MKKLTVKKIMEMQDAGQTLYVRWSRGQKWDKKPSRDYLTGSVHAGLSAVKLGYWDEKYMARRLNEYGFLRMKDSKIKPYIVIGKEVGIDSDGYESIEVSEWIGEWDQKGLE